MDDRVAQLRRQWATDPRWSGIERTYGAAEVVALRGSVQEEHTLARLGAQRLWSLLRADGYVNTLGALTGNQAVQQVKARSEEHTSELQSPDHLVCRLLLEKKKT